MKKFALCLFVIGALTLTLLPAPAAKVADFEIPGPKVSCLYYA